MNLKKLKVGDVVYLGGSLVGQSSSRIASGPQRVIKVGKKYVTIGPTEYVCTRLHLDTVREVESPYRAAYRDEEHYHTVRQFRQEVRELENVLRYGSHNLVDLTDEDVEAVRQLRAKFEKV